MYSTSLLTKKLVPTHKRDNSGSGNSFHRGSQAGNLIKTDQDGKPASEPGG